jgi:hypothetical protein
MIVEPSDLHLNPYLQFLALLSVDWWSVVVSARGKLDISSARQHTPALINNVSPLNIAAGQDYPLLAEMGVGDA